MGGRHEGARLRRRRCRCRDSAACSEAGRCCGSVLGKQRLGHRHCLAGEPGLAAHDQPGCGCGQGQHCREPPQLKSCDRIRSRPGVLRRGRGDAPAQGRPCKRCVHRSPQLRHWRVRVGQAQPHSGSHAREEHGRHGGRDVRLAVPQHGSSEHHDSSCDGVGNQGPGPRQGQNGGGAKPGRKTRRLSEQHCSNEGSPDRQPRPQHSPVQRPPARKLARRRPGLQPGAAERLRGRPGQRHEGSGGNDRKADTKGYCQRAPAWRPTRAQANDQRHRGGHDSHRNRPHGEVAPQRRRRAGHARGNGPVAQPVDERPLEPVAALLGRNDAEELDPVEHEARHHCPVGQGHLGSRGGERRQPVEAHSGPNRPQLDALRAGPRPGAARGCRPRGGGGTPASRCQRHRA
mmetsp:Transcript_4426/g.18795  ORF Transcript_4426/g.18795 Transcript_4426/m.18795 type:complete len:402 (+) Transcript_4426:418-1623(+)